jgi:hypothetical protein
LARERARTIQAVAALRTRSRIARTRRQITGLDGEVVLDETARIAVLQALADASVDVTEGCKS